MSTFQSLFSDFIQNCLLPLIQLRRKYNYYNTISDEGFNELIQTDILAPENYSNLMRNLKEWEVETTNMSQDLGKMTQNFNGEEEALNELVSDLSLVSQYLIKIKQIKSEQIKNIKSQGILINEILINS